jgi:hypothetical protein
MLHLESNWKTMSFAAAATAVAVLAGCAIAVPLRPLSTSSQKSSNGDTTCTVKPRCSNGSADHRVAYRRSQPVTGKLDNDPPDFILNSADQEDTLR